MSSVWIEAALNGPWGRYRQAGIPVTVAEIVSDGLAAANAGAAIIHVHAYDSASGQQRDEWETYARIIEGIRSKVDVIVYPTIPLAGSEFAASNAQRRFAHTAELAKRGLIEWTVVDPGSVNFVRYDQAKTSSDSFVYQNSLSDIREGLRVALQYQLHPGYAIYEPGFTRLGAALAHDMANLATPIYRLMFSDEFAWGFPANPVYLEAHLELLRNLVPDAPWMVAGLGVDIRGNRARRPCPRWTRRRAVGDATDEPPMGRRGHAPDPRKSRRTRECSGSQGKPQRDRLATEGPVFSLTVR